MVEWFNNFKQSPYFNDVAFVVALLLILLAWKMGIEGLISEAVD